MKDLIKIVHSLDRAIVRTLTKDLEAVGISSQQYLILQALSQTIDQPSAIAQTTGLNPATVTGLIKNLAASGLISRKGSVSDLRTVRIVFTNKGKKVYNSSTKIVDKFTNSVTLGISAENLEIFTKAAKNVQNRLESNK